MAVHEPPPKSESRLKPINHSIASCSCSEKFHEHVSGRPIKHFIPPGALSSYSQAQRSMMLRGFKAVTMPAHWQSDSYRIADNVDDHIRRKSSVQQPAFPCKTIAALFSHRRHRVTLRAHCAAFKQQVAQQDGHSNLLRLPDELLVKVICNLRHDETSPIAKVCRQMKTAVHEAIQLHFDYSTPVANTHADLPGAPRAKRIRYADRDGDLQPDIRPQNTQPARALRFSVPSKEETRLAKPEAAIEGFQALSMSKP